MDGVLQVQGFDDRCGVRRIGVHVMAVGGLRGAAVAAAVVGNDPITVLQEKQHLRVPVVRTERPAMVKHDRLALPPILVKNLGAVFGLYVAAHVFDS